VNQTRSFGTPRAQSLASLTDPRSCFERQVCTFHDRTNVYMLISLCQGGDLLAAQEKWNNSQMSESTAQFYIACIILALEYLHSLNIAYRDMKQENMMIDAQVCA
jgi:serine/threonine protein kinase